MYGRAHLEREQLEPPPNVGYSADGDGVDMICQSCRDKNHEECTGSNWCDCQHRQSTEPPEDIVIIVP